MRNIIGAISLNEFKSAVPDFFTARGYIGAYRPVGTYTTPLIKNIFSNYPTGFWKEYIAKYLEDNTPIEEKIKEEESFIWDSKKNQGSFSDIARAYGIEYVCIFSKNGSSLQMANLSHGKDAEFLLKVQPFFQDYLSLFNEKYAHLKEQNTHTTLLSPREIECLKWTRGGKTIAEIGSILHILERTVKLHLHNTYNKMGVGNKTAAVAKAITEKII